MKTFTDRYFHALEKDLRLLQASSQPSTEHYRAAITLCKKAMNKLKTHTAGYTFSSINEEIDFFKNDKPRFYSRYIYYVNLFNYQVQKPIGSGEIQEAYIKMHLDEIKTFFDHNRAFYLYYRAGMTQLDEAYYTRGGFNVYAELEDFEEDQQYSTSHDYKLSKIMANEKFQEYLSQELVRHNLTTEERKAPLPFSLPNWTATQTDAIELIYALKASGAVNNGNIDISELIILWEFIFQIELKEYYHKFTDITRRKKEVPVFLNRLREGLLKWIDDKLAY